MKLYIYCYFNKEGDFFGNPFVEKLDPEVYKDAFVQGLVGLKTEVLDTLKVDDLYYFGTFDNISGEIVIKKEFLAHVSDAVASIMAKRIEVKENGSEENA